MDIVISIALGWSLGGALARGDFPTILLSGLSVASILTGYVDIVVK